MAAAFVQAQSGTGTSSSATATFGATPTSGNLMVAWIVMTTQRTISAAPSGWAVLCTLAGAGAGGAGRTGVAYYKIAGASEPTNPAWTLDVSATWILLLGEWSGIDTTTPLDAHPASAVQASGSPVSTPAATPTTVAGLCVMMYGNRPSVGVTWSTYTLTGSPTITERLDAASGVALSAAFAEAVFTPPASSHTGTVVPSTAAVGVSAIAFFKEAAAASILPLPARRRVIRLQR